MAIDTTTPRSRRAVLTAVAGGAAAVVAASVARIHPVEAANGDAVKVGQANTGTSTTLIENRNGGYALHVKGPDGGIRAEALAAPALSGMSTQGLGLDIESGRVRFQHISGVATIKKGRKSVAVRPGVDINPRTFVLLTPRTNIGSRGLWYTTSGANDQFAIRMSSARGAPTKVAWLALERG